MSAPFRIEAIDLAAIEEAQGTQIARGHTRASDRELAVGRLGETMVEHGKLARDAGQEGDRQDLAIAYRRAARAGAMVLAYMARIRAEQAGRARQADRHVR